MLEQGVAHRAFCSMLHMMLFRAPGMDPMYAHPVHEDACSKNNGNNARLMCNRSLQPHTTDYYESGSRDACKATGCKPGAMANAWLAEMAKFVKSLDGSHLVSPPHCLTSCSSLASNACTASRAEVPAPLSIGVTVRRCGKAKFATFGSALKNSIVRVGLQNYSLQIRCHIASQPEPMQRCKCPGYNRRGGIPR